MTHLEHDDVRIQRVATEADLQAFLRFPRMIYQHDPCWISPLRSELERRLDVARNPFFAHARRELFIAWRGAVPVGTIGAIVNDQHNQQFSERTGFFGFFQSIDDQNVADALVRTVEHWLQARGMAMMRGPIDGAPTDECGVLIAGHDRRPAIWEAHTPPYYQALLERQRFTKYDDVFAYEFALSRLERDGDLLPPLVHRIAARLHTSTSVSVRSVNDRTWEADVAIAHMLYNTAFRTIPGHNDMSFANFRALAQSLRPFLDRDLMLLAEVDGRPAGFAVALPDLNEALAMLNGEESLWNLIKLHWYRRRIRTICFKLLGVLPEYRGRGLETVLGLEIVRRSLAKGYTRVELSLVSEKNAVVNRLLRRMGAEVYRTYRIYERPL